MKRKQIERTAREAVVLAVVLERRLPACCPVPPEDLLAAVWPLAVRLTRLERRARRDKKAARRYRRARREAAELVRTWPESPVPLAALERTVALDASCWRTVLVPGAAVEALRAA